MAGLTACTIGFLAAGLGTLQALRPSSQRDDKRSISFSIQRLNDEPENPVADICFVHGLNEDRVSTWSSTPSDGKDKFFWPEDLQKQINARILLYGYSTVAPTAEYLARRTLYRQADHLVESLADARKDHPRRPLIFVAHSLGGLVVKSGLIFSFQSPTRAIVLSTVGIVLLGTPHKVHGHLSSSPSLQKIAMISGLSRKVRKYLDDESRSLQSCLEPFEALSTDIPMISFFESQGTGSFGVIVPPSTAVIGGKSLLLDSNHANLAKFHDPNDKNYVKVASAIRELCQEATSLVDKNWDKYQQELNPYPNKGKRLEDFWVPPQLPVQSSCFTANEDALKWIEDSLLGKSSPDRPNNCHTVNLHGIAGIGKTQIALAFANRFRDRFSSVFWIPSQTRTAVEHKFLEIARTLQLPTFEAGDEHEIAYSLLEWLESSRNIGWLLIFDDVDLSAAPDVKELIPTCVHGHVIITSRAPLNLPFAMAYRVGPLQVEELEPREYLLYNKRQSKLSSEDSSGNQSLSIAFAEFNGISQPAKLLFTMCCMLSLEAIPLWIFEEGSAPLSSKRILRQSISVLEKLDLIVQQPSQPHIQIDSLIRGYGRRMLPATLQSDACRELCETASYVAVRFLEPASDGTSSSEKELGELIVDALSIIPSHQASSPKWDVNLEELGKVCQALGRFSEAANFYKLHLERNRGPETSISRAKLRLALTRRHTGGQHLETGTNSEDNGLVTQFQKAIEAAPDDESLRELKSLNCEQDDPEQELEVLRMIIEAQEKRSGPMSSLMLESIQDISSRLVEQGFRDEAEATLRRILMSYHKLHGARHRSTIRIAERLASVCLSLGKLDEAEAICDDVIDDYKKRLGRDHASTQRCLAQLAFTYDLQGRYDDAEPLFIDAVETLTKTVGPDHPDVLRIQHNYALNLMKLGRTRKSQELLEDALRRMEAHPEIHPMKARRRTAIQLFQEIEGDSNVREGDELWEMGRHLEDKYELRTMMG